MIAPSLDLATFLATKKPILMEGAMGTELAKRSADMGGRSTLTHPEQVLAIHRDYVGCGCRMLITNTLTMNRIFLDGHKDIDLREVNLTGARLARQAVGPERYVLGDISSTGKLLKPYGQLTEEVALTAFAEQAALLAEGGVDGFLIETMMDLKEALCALRACQSVSTLPVIVSMAFKTPKNGGRTMMGDTAKDCAQALTEAGACVIGANCGDIDPLQTAEVVAMLHAETALPILAKPNAGKPRLVDGKVIYDMPITAFLAGMTACLEAGAILVGGCCGTAPDYIQALADAIRPDE